MKFWIAVAAAALSATAASAANAEGTNGPWLEARAGWDRYSLEGESTDGALYGAAFGYDIAVGNKVFVGVQAGMVGSTARECELGLCVGSGRDIELLARAGVAVAQRTSVYALAGYADGRINATENDARIGAVTTGGLRLGAGVEQGFGGKTYSKLEYRYTDYGDIAAFGEEVNAGNRHQLSVSFGVRF